MVTGRRTTRFVAHDRIEVKFAERGELKELYTRDISKGGLFIEATEPVSLRSRIEVSLVVGAEAITLEAEIVHVIDAATAAQIGMSPGFGVQFLSLDGPKRALLERYVDGLVAAAPSEATPAGPAPGDALAEARRFLAALDTGDPYAALAIHPEATDHELRGRYGEMSAMLTASASLTPPQAARVETARRKLDQLLKCLLAPDWRLEHDLRSGHVRAERRALGASKEELDRMRAVWLRVNGSKIDDAAIHARDALAAEARKDLAAAVAAGQKALELDPFNHELRETIIRWKSGGDRR